MIAIACLSAGAWGQVPAPSDDPAADPIQVRVNELRLEGNTALPDEVFQEILDAYQGRLLSFEDIRRVADAIVTKYRENDYLTVSAYLPEQDLNDGVVTIQVVEASVDQVSVEGNQHYSEEYIRWMFEPALWKADGGLPKRSDIQRQLLLLNDTSDLFVRSVVREGEKEGTVGLILQSQDSRPIHFGLDYNNLGARATGRNRLGATFEWGNFSNAGDTLRLRYVESDLLNPNTDGLDLFNVSYSRPLTNTGTYFDLSYANSAFGVGEELQILDIRGEADVISVGLRQNLLRSSDANVDITGSFVYQDISNSILGQQFSRDKLRELVLGISGDCAGGGGRTYGSGRITQDLGPAFGGTSPNDPMASRGAGGGFTKLNFDLSRVQKLNDISYLVLRAAHQTTFSPLPFAEQFGLGGLSTVRGYGQSSYLGDTGYNVSAEVRFAPIEGQRQLFEVGAFIDHGGAAVKNPLPGEIPNASLTGAGVTFQLRLPEQTYIRADLGWPLGNKSVLPNTEDGPVPYVLFSKRF